MASGFINDSGFCESFIYFNILSKLSNRFLIFLNFYLQTSGGYLIFYKLGADDNVKTVYDLIDSPTPSLKRDCAELFVKENIPSVHLKLVQQSIFLLKYFVSKFNLYIFLFI